METRIPKNVIRQTRLSLGMTQEELAQLAGISRQRLIREEQFISVDPSDAVVKALSVRSNDLTSVDIIRRYQKSRTRLLAQFSEDLVSSPFYQDRVSDAFNYALDYFDALPVLRSPTKMFREYLFEHYGLPTSAIKFCQFTGMHPATLSDIETGKTDWKGATALINVLSDRLAISKQHLSGLGTIHDSYFIRKG
jgi:transcriptional regulator with XRE-family HTH domain